MKNNNFNYISGLDGLRAISVFGVLLSHYTLGDSIDKYLKLIPWGDMGVKFFFVLSGFLITTILLKCKHLSITYNCSKHYLLRIFYARRFLRIFPLYYGVLILAYLFNVGSIKKIFIYHFLYLSNTSSALTGTLTHAPLIDPTTAHFWSLAVEEQFYIFWPFIVMYISIRNLKILILSLIFLSPAFRLIWFLLGFDHLYSYFPMCLDTLGCGSILALYVDDKSGFNFMSRFQIKLLLISAISTYIVVLGLYGFEIWYRPRIIIFDTAQGIIYSLVIYFILIRRIEILNCILESKFLIFIGKISYGIYIIHPFIPHIFSYYFPVNNLSVLEKFFVFVTLTILFSWFSFVFYEKRFNKIKKHFQYSYNY